VAELRSVAEQLDPKYQFLLEAPDVDPEGNPTVVKFSRKNQHICGLRLLKESKPSGVWCSKMGNGLKLKH
jgi:hypothetical protein